jgi:hypothetical protein
LYLVLAVSQLQAPGYNLVRHLPECRVPQALSHSAEDGTLAQ